MSDRNGADGGEPLPENLAEPLEALADVLDGVETARAPGGGVEYRRGGVAFATRDGIVVAFRLREEVVDAALRTPDTRRSKRGPQWIELTPKAVDTFTLDRAMAWFESAWRMAGEPPAPREGQLRPH